MPDAAESRGPTIHSVVMDERTTDLFQMLALDDAGCSCDPRFVPVAYDIDCPVHGVGSLIGRIGDSNQTKQSRPGGVREQ